MSQALAENSLNVPPPEMPPGCQVTKTYNAVADEAFPLRPYIMKPYARRGFDRNERILNYRLSRARRILANAFDILASRFRMFRSPITMLTSSVVKLVMAAVVLHNYLRSTSGDHYWSERALDNEDVKSGNVNGGIWRNDTDNAGMVRLQPACGKASTQAQDVRDLWNILFENEQLNGSGSTAYNVSNRYSNFCMYCFMLGGNIKRLP
jgi:hypothetical protein